MVLRCETCLPVTEKCGVKYGSKRMMMMLVSIEVVACLLGCDVKKDLVTCPIKYGGILIFNNITPHQRSVKRNLSRYIFSFAA